MRRKAVWIGIPYIIGLIFAAFSPPSRDLIIYPVILAAILITLFVKAARKWTLTSIIFLAAFLFFRIYDYNCRLPIELLHSQRVNFSGTVLSCDVKAADKAVYTVKGKINCKIPAKLQICADNYGCCAGASVRFECTLREIESEYGFDAKSYYLGKGIFAEAEDVTDFKTGKVNILLFAVENYREMVLSTVHRYLPNDEGDMLSAMLCGEKGGLDYCLRSELYRVGIGHIIAVSGLHVVIIAKLASKMIGRIIPARHGGYILLGIILLLFSLLCGCTPSVLRASVMVMLLLLSKLFGRRADPLTSLIIAAAIIGTLSPCSVRDSSFLLSFSAMWGLLVLAPRLTEKCKGKLFYRFRTAALSSFAITVSVAPISMLLFGELSLLSPLSNAVCLPICSLAVAAGFIALLFANLPFLAAPFLIFAGLCCKAVIFICKILVKIPVGFIKSDFSSVKICVIIVALSFLAVIFRKRHGNYRIFTVLTFLLLLTINITADNYTKGLETIAFIADENYCAAVIISGGSAVIVDIDGDGRAAYPVSGYLSYRAVSRITAVTTSRHESTKAEYIAYLPDIPTAVIKAEDGIFCGDKNAAVCAADGFTFICGGRELFFSEAECCGFDKSREMIFETDKIRIRRLE